MSHTRASGAHDPNFYSRSFSYSKTLLASFVILASAMSALGAGVLVEDLALNTFRGWPAISSSVFPTGEDGADPALVIVSYSAPTIGTATHIDGGRFIYTPPLGFVGATSFEYLVTDGEVVDRATVFVNVDPIELSGDGIRRGSGLRLRHPSPGGLADGVVTLLHDFDGDGVGDLAVGVPGDGLDARGRVYIVSGSAGVTDPVVSLEPEAFEDTAPAHRVLVIEGAQPGDRLGAALALAQDWNADGLSDLLIGAPGSDANGNRTGRAYVVFGRSFAPTPSPILSVSELQNGDGVVIEGAPAGASLGATVAGIGDIDGDGIADFVIGAPGDDTQGPGRGAAYVLLGSPSERSSPIDVRNLTGSDGFVAPGRFSEDHAGITVSGAGDVDGDGISDFLVGAAGPLRGGDRSPEVLLIYGRSEGFPPVLDLAALDGTLGVTFEDLVSGDEGGRDPRGLPLAPLGDVDGDGRGDIAIGVPFGPGDGTGRGRTFGIYGFEREEAVGRISAESFLGQSTRRGFLLEGALAGGRIGGALTGVGDFDGDGLSDLAIGDGPAVLPEPGSAYLLFGSASELSGPVPLDGLPSLDPQSVRSLKFRGLRAATEAGNLLAGGVDVNADGFTDMAVGGLVTSGSDSWDRGVDVFFGRAIGLDVDLGPGAVIAENQTLKVIQGHSISSRLGVVAAKEEHPLFFEFLPLLPRGAFTLLDQSTGEFTYTPSPGFLGLDPVRFRVTGASGGSSDATILFSVLASGPPPSSGDLNVVVEKDSLDNPIRLVVHGVNTPEVATIQIVDSPIQGEVTHLFPGSASVLYTPHSDVFGQDRFTYRVTDGGSTSDLATVEIRINAPPIAASDRFFIATDLPDVIGQVSATDPDSITPLSYRVVTGPSSGELLSFDEETGAFHYRPGSDLVGGDSFTFAASDETVEGDPATIDLAVNVPPEVTSDTLVFPGGTGPYTIRPQASDPDSSGPLTFSLGSPTLGTISDFDPTTGRFTYTPFPAVDAAGGEDFLFVSVSDGLDSDNGLLTIQIEPAVSLTPAVSLAGIAAGSDNSGSVLRSFLQDEQAGFFVDHIGDLNGDGIGDFAVGSAGFLHDLTYVVFGRPGGLEPVLDLRTLTPTGGGNGSTGFVIDGSLEFGKTVSGIGDIDGDGFDDLAVGNPFRGGSFGRVYVLFGRARFPSRVVFGNTEGGQGFLISGSAPDFGGTPADMGPSISGGKDLNGDGLADLVIGDPGGDVETDPGPRVYLVYSRPRVDGQSTFPALLQTRDLLPAFGGDGSLGTVLSGAPEGSELGTSVALVDDLNGDGIADIVLGAPGASGVAPQAGRTYVIFGQGGGLGAHFDLAELLPANGGDGSRGSVLLGDQQGMRAGSRVAGVGDLDEDGLEDLVVSAFGGFGGHLPDVQAFLLYGQGTWPPTISFEELRASNGADGSRGVVLRVTEDFPVDLGISLSGGGDWNNDGVPDLVIGAPPSDDLARGIRNDLGRAFVLTGGPRKRLGAEFFLDSLLDPASSAQGLGIQINGAALRDDAGRAVSLRGDLDGDGLSDLLVGAPLATTHPAGFRNGEVYLLRGRSIGLRIIAEPARHALASGATFAGTLETNQTNPGEVRRFEIARNITEGSLILDPDTGAFQYSAAPDQVGPDYFRYRVTDDEGQVSNTATISFFVSAPAIALGGEETIDEDTSFSGLLPVDNPDGDSLHFEIVRPPSSGQLVLHDNATGSFSYFPALDFFGEDSFEYTVTDGISTSEAATFTFEVLPVNDPPVGFFAAVTLELPEDSGPAPGLVEATDINEDPVLTFSLVDPPTNGTLRDGDPDPVTGEFEYTPNQDFFGSDSFSFQVSDGTTLSAVVTVPIEVAPVNDAPIVGPVSDTTDQGVSVVLVPPVIDVDQETQFSFQVVQAPTLGTALPVSGGILYTPNEGVTGVDGFTFLALDAAGAESNVSTATVTIESVDQPPTPGSPTFEVLEDAHLDAPFSGQLTATDPDSPALTFSLAPGNQVTLVADLSVSPDGVVSFRSALNQNGSQSYKYTVDDGFNAPVTGTFTVSVAAVNDAPEFFTAGPYSATSGETTPLSGLEMTDVDDENGPARVKLTVKHGTLDLGETTGLTFEPGFEPVSPSVAFVAASLTEANTALESVTYTSVTSFEGVDTLQIEFDDQGGTGIGDPQGGTTSASITVVPDLFFPPGQAMERLSVPDPGVPLFIQSDQNSSQPISADGRYTAFLSNASNLTTQPVPLFQTNAYLHDSVTGVVQLVSSRPDGSPTSESGQTRLPDLTPDGRYVVYTSFSSELVPGVTGQNVFRWDRVTRTNELVSSDSNGSPASGGGSNRASISANGRYVVFESNSAPFTPDPFQLRIVLKDMQTQAYQVFPVGPPSGLSLDISDDGQYVGFLSTSALVPEDVNGTTDLYRYEVATGNIELLSRNQSGGNLTSSGGVGNFGVLGPSGDVAVYSGDGKFLHRDLSSGLITPLPIPISIRFFEVEGPTISLDGSKVAFYSRNEDLVPGDSNGQYDFFIWEVPAGILRLGSIAFGGQQANGDSGGSSISRDGNCISFDSFASNLVPEDTNLVNDVFVLHDHTGTTNRISKGVSPEENREAIDETFQVSLSRDGSVALFASDAPNLAKDDRNGDNDMFIRDRLAGTTELVSLLPAGGQAAQAEFGGRDPVAHLLTEDRSHVLFTATDFSGNSGIYLRNLEQAVSERVDVNSAGVPAAPEGSFGGNLSSDARWIAFVTGDSNLVENDTNSRDDVFLHDRDTGTTIRVSETLSGIEADGNSFDPIDFGCGDTCLLFGTNATNLSPPNVLEFTQVYFRSFLPQLGPLELVSTNAAGDPANSFVSRAHLARDGRYVVLTSRATNLVPGFGDGSRSQVFRKDRVTGAVEPVSVTLTGGPVDDSEEGCSDAVISGNGRWVAFGCRSTELVLGAVDEFNIYVRDMDTEQTALVSRPGDPQLAPDKSSFAPFISADGRYIAFISQATNLVDENLDGVYDDDTNGVGDAFVAPNPLYVPPGP